MLWYSCSAPRIEQEDLQREFSQLSTEEKEEVRNDIEGRRKIRRNDGNRDKLRVDDKLKELDSLLRNPRPAPDGNRRPLRNENGGASFTLAQDTCPSYVNSDAFRLMILRSCDFNVEQSVRRMLQYWEDKLHLFGSGAAFRELRFGDLNMPERKHICEGFIRILPETDRFGRQVMWMDHQVWNRASQDAILRAIWFAVHEILKDEYVQTSGIVIIFVSPCRFCLKQHFDRKCHNHILRSLRDGLPVKVAAFHILMQNTEVNLVLPNMLHMLGPMIRARVVIHSGWYSQTLKRLESYGIPHDLVGGPVKLGERKSRRGASCFGDGFSSSMKISSPPSRRSGVVRSKSMP